jgi:hypothetical protein
MWTLELPWRGNERYNSCIPEGVYRAVKHDSPKFGATLWLRDVPERSEILIHPANMPSQLEGCIAPGGELRTYAHGALGVLYSRIALSKLLEAVEDTVDVDIRPFRVEYP